MDKKTILKILILEDNPDDVSLIQRVLEKGKLDYTAQCVQSRDEYCEAISLFQPDVVLSDHRLPGFNSHDALKICLKERSTTPFILVSGTVSDEQAVSCLQEGASDYIFKSNLSRLPLAISNAIKKKKLERLKRDSRHSLRKQNKKLLKVNDELDSFFYSISHNLRGPLASVMGLLHLAKREQEAVIILPLLNMMESSIINLDQTLNDFLHFSRNAHNDIQVVEVDWMPMIKKVLTKLKYLDSNETITKMIHLDTAHHFYSDELRITMIMENILSNAMCYKSEKREAIISIDVIVSKDMAQIVLKDNGLGIHSDVLPRVFDIFYRGVEKSKGAGLGLYITREIIQKLNGRISINSTIDVGTTVTIQLPSLSQMKLNGNLHK